jgi:hypothetical protein
MSFHSRSSLGIRIISKDISAFVPISLVAYIIDLTPETYFPWLHTGHLEKNIKKRVQSLSDTVYNTWLVMVNKP